MNREEADLEAWSVCDTENAENCAKLVSSIYDDFESRTCENCVNNQIDIVHDDIYGWCNEICYQVEHFKTTKDFGCNKFERKTDGN
jgi:hypothetical protein